MRKEGGRKGGREDVRCVERDEGGVNGRVPEALSDGSW